DVEKPEELFPRLAQRKPGDWHRSWLKHRMSYSIDSLHDVADEVALEEVSSRPAIGENEPEERFQKLLKKARFDEEEPDAKAAAAEAEKAADEKLELETRKKLDYPGIPSAASQFSILLSRRWKIFFRDRGQLW